MIRTILVFVFLALFFIVGLGVMLIGWILGKIDPAKREALNYGYVRFGFRCVGVISGIKLIVEGRENIPDEPVMFAANHRSFFDIVTGFYGLPGYYGYIAKKELLKVPFLRVWMRYIHCLFLDRDDIKAGVQMINDAVDMIKNGISVFIFPEGTRNKEEGTLLPFHGGSFKIAIRSGCPVVPVTFIGTGAIFEDHFPSIRPGTVKIIVGKPILTQGMPVSARKTLPEDCRKVIEAALTAGREEN